MHIESMDLSALPDSPALQAVRAEYADIMNNPDNPRHAGFQRGDPQVSAYIDGLYAGELGFFGKAASPPTQHQRGDDNVFSSNLTAPEPESLTLKTAWSPDAPLPDLSPDEAKAMADLRQEWGEDAETRYAEAQVGIRHLEGKFGKEAVDDLNEALVAAGGDIKLILKIAQYLGHKAHPYVS